MSTSITPPPNSCQAPEGSITNHTPSPSTLTLLHSLQSAYAKARHHGLCPSAAAHLASSPSPLPTTPYTPPPHPAPQHPSQCTQPPLTCDCRYHLPSSSECTHPPICNSPSPRPDTAVGVMCGKDDSREGGAADVSVCKAQGSDMQAKVGQLSSAQAKMAACRQQFLASYERAKAAKLDAALRQLFSTQYDRVHWRDGELLGCKHYARNCKLKAKCCGVFVSCRFCHDEAMGGDHEIDRFATEEVICMLCLTEQPVGERCVACGERFAHWYCGECRFYENTPGKKVYHCGRCKICRLGEGLGIDNYHCDNCDACVSLSSREHHRCIGKALHTNCPVCRGYLFTSTEPVFFMRCGHTMHKRCFETYTRDRYQCPLCMKSLKNMSRVFREIDEQVRREPMPAEYENKRSLILCNDCGAKSWVKYHFTYHKCGSSECDGSYNTVQLKVADVGGGMGAEAGAAEEWASGEDGQRGKSSVGRGERG